MDILGNKAIRIENLNPSLGWFSQIYNLNLRNEAICPQTCEIHPLLNFNASEVSVTKRSSSSLKVYTLTKSLGVFVCFTIIFKNRFWGVTPYVPCQTPPKHLAFLFDSFSPFLIFGCVPCPVWLLVVFLRRVKHWHLFRTLLVYHSSSHCHNMSYTCFTGYLPKSWEFFFLRPQFTCVPCAW